MTRKVCMAAMGVSVLALVQLGARQALTDRQRIEQAQALIAPLEGRVTAKGVTNLRNILTRLDTLKGQLLDPNHSDVQPPSPVDCVLSDWSLQASTDWSACQPNNTQTRTETWERSVVTEPAHGGQACAPLEKTETMTQSCTYAPPAPTGDANVWKFVTPSYSGAPDGGKIFPQQWQTPTGGIYDPVSKRTCVNDRWHDSVRSNSIYANAWICYDPVTNAAEVVSITNWRVVTCSKEPGVCVNSASYYETHPIPGRPVTPVDGHPFNGGIVFDPVERAIYRINGANTSAFPFTNYQHVKETWKMPLATGVWEKLLDGRAPGVLHPPSDLIGDIDDYGCAFYDPAVKRIIYFEITNTRTITWEFDPPTKAWALKPVDPSAEGRLTAIAGCAYDTKRNRVLVLGGGRHLRYPDKSDPSWQKLAAYSAVTNTWTDLATPPVVTYSPEFAYSPKADIALAVVTVQQDDKSGVSSTYAYHPATDTWETLPGTFNRGRVTFGQTGTVTYNPAQDLFVFHGGTWDKPLWATFRYQGAVAPPPAPEPEPVPIPDPVPTPEPPPAPGSGVGVGCTSIYFIDVDCDGYGVGVRSSGVYGVQVPGLGDRPDADDADPTINTPASVLAKFDANVSGVLEASELRAFLAAHKGITANQIFYVSPDGNNATGAPDDPLKPFASYYQPVSAVPGLRKFLQPGDVVVWRGGIYTEKLGGCCPSLVSGSAGAPITLISAPGESVRLHTALLSTSGAQHVVIDGFSLENPSAPNLGNGLVLSASQFITVRNVEIQRYNFPSAMQDMHHILVERFLTHHQYEHGLYFGSRDLPNSNLTIRESIFYANGVNTKYGAFQHNGRVTNLRVERNIMHSNGQWGVSLAQGVSKSIIQNNLMFNNQGNAIIFQVYFRTPEEEAQCAAGTLTICPYEQVDNLITNNTIWIGKYNLRGEIPSTPQDATAILISRNGAGDPGDGRYAQARNTVQNNVMVVDRGPVLRENVAEWLPTWTVRNNVVYRRAGASALIRFGSTLYDLAGFGSTFPLATNNVFTDPLFKAESIDFWASPHLFDLRLTASSPAIGFGTATSAPATDVRGSVRGVSIDAGAYRK